MARDDFESVAADALANAKLWSRSLIDVPGLAELVKKDLGLMLAEGMTAALTKALEEAKK